MPAAAAAQVCVSCRHWLRTPGCIMQRHRHPPPPSRPPVARTRYSCSSGPLSCLLSPCPSSSATSFSCLATSENSVCTSARQYSAPKMPAEAEHSKRRHNGQHSKPRCLASTAAPGRPDADDYQRVSMPHQEQHAASCLTYTAGAQRQQQDAAGWAQQPAGKQVCVDVAKLVDELLHVRDQHLEEQGGGGAAAGSTHRCKACQRAAAGHAPARNSLVTDLQHGIEPRTPSFLHL